MDCCIVDNNAISKLEYINGYLSRKNVLSTVFSLKIY